jgi:5'-nucleotidase
VHLALTGMLEFEPDIVVSRHQQHSANMGDDVIYSGTVRRRWKGVSSACRRSRCRWPRATTIREALRDRGARGALRSWRGCWPIRCRPTPSSTSTCPTWPWAEMRGFEVTRLGIAIVPNPACRRTTRVAATIWWIGPAGPEQDAGPGTDFHAVRRGFISITPIHVDLTRYTALDKVAGWVGLPSRSGGVGA